MFSVFKHQILTIMLITFLASSLQAPSLLDTLQPTGEDSTTKSVTITSISFKPFSQSQELSKSTEKSYTGQIGSSKASLTDDETFTGEDDGDKHHTSRIGLDGGPPKFDESPGNDHQLNESDEMYIYYQITDPDGAGDYYDLYIDGVFNVSDNYDDGVRFNISLTGYPLGQYNFDMFAYDIEGKEGKDSSTVTIFDGTLPQLVTQASNITYNVYDTGNFLTWNATDKYPTTYTVFDNGIEFTNGTYDSENDTIVNVDGLSPGLHEIKIEFYDIGNNIRSHTVWVTVHDDINPTIVEKSTNTTIDITSTGNILFWNATDELPGTYEIYKDTILVDSGSWSNETEITIPIDGLDYGDYNYTIRILDSQDNEVVDTVWVTVTDLIYPEILTEPGNYSYNEGEEGNTLTWSATDLNPDTYDIYKDGKFHSGGSWFNASEITIGIDGLILGLYNYTIVFFDDYNNLMSNTAWVQVNDTTPPMLVSEAEDLVYANGTQGHELEWSAKDNTPGTYEIIYNNISTVQTGNWDSNVLISINVDGLEVGEHNYTIFFYDSSGNSISDIAYVTVSNAPTFTDTPGDITYIEGETGNSLSWTVSSADPDYYYVYDNDSFVADQGEWDNGISIPINVDGLTIGVYNYTIWLNDTNGNAVTNTAFVTVTDVPFIENEPVGSQLEYAEGSSGNVLNWTVTDSNPNYYQVYNNSEFFIEGNWTSGVNITVNIDGLLKGSYNFTIIVYDHSGNSNSSSVIVSIIDSLSPQFENISDTTEFPEDGTGHTFYWNFTENYPDTYEIFVNKSSVQVGSWESQVPISVPVDTSLKGVYNYTIIVYDTSGNYEIHTIWITISDQTNPVFNDYSEDFSYNEGETGNEIYFNATDRHAGSYVILENDVEIDSGPWENYTLHTLPIDDRSLGLYNYTIIIYDEDGLSSQVTIFVQVREDVPPEIVEKPSDTVSYVEGDMSEFWLTWNATDAHNDTYELYKDGNIVKQGGWQNSTEVTYDAGGLPFGSYNFTIIFYDEYGNYVVHTITLNVLDEEAPVLDTTPQSSYDIAESDTPAPLQWNATDLHPIIYEIWTNSSLDSFYPANMQIQNGTWTSGQLISLDIDDFATGLYNITIFFFDAGGNNVTHTVLLTVTDNLAPELTFEDSDNLFEFDEGTVENVLFWRATDSNSDFYELFVDDELNHTDFWESDVAVGFTLDSLKKDTYNYTIVFYDESGNFVVSTVIVQVYDGDAPEQQLILVDSPMIEESTGNELTFVYTDAYPDTWQLMDGLSLIDQGVWTSSEAATASLDSLTKGSYNLSLYVYDESGNFALHFIQLEVIDTKTPEFVSTPTNQTYIEDSGSLDLNWSVFDNYPDTYEVYLDGQLIANSEWSSSTAILVSIPDLEARTSLYNITIVVFDESLNVNIQTFFVTSIDTSAPLITSPGDQNFTTIDPTMVVTWTVYDRHLAAYSIYVDGDIRRGDAIFEDPETEISIDFKFLDFNFDGYNITLEVHDESGNSGIATIILKITDPDFEDTNTPQILLLSDVYEGDMEMMLLSWDYVNGSDVVGNSSLIIEFRDSVGNILRSQTFYSTDGEFNISLDYTGVDPGNYFWNFAFMNYLHENQTGIQRAVTIHPHTIVIEIQTSGNIVRGQEYRIVAVAKYNNSPYNNISDGISLDDYDNVYMPRTGYVSNLGIEVNIEAINLDGERFTLARGGTTDSSGTVIITLTSSDTQNIQKITSIQATIATDNPLFTPTFENLSEESVPTVIEIVPFYVKIGRVVSQYWYMFIILLTIFAYSGYILLNRQRAQYRYMNKIMKDLVFAERELEGIQSIQAMLVQTATGIPLYETQIREFGFDSVLISGLSNAISSFLTELDKEETFDFEVMERSSISITSHRGKMSTFIVISNARLPLILLDQIKTVHENMEREFKDILEGGERGFDLFPISKVEQIFHESQFKILLVNKLLIDHQQIRKLTRVKSLSRIFRSKLSLLLEFTPKGPGGTFSLPEVITFLRDNLMNKDMIARIIILSYVNEIIVPIFRDDTEIFEIDSSDASLDI